jgi:hypothetical protein
MDHGDMDHGEMQHGEMSAEEAAMMAAMEKAMTPGEPHEKLAASAGDWKLTVKSWMDPSQPPMVEESTAHREMVLGGRVLHETVKGTAMGRPFRGEGHTGYDNVRGEYWSTWMDSMSTAVLVSRGSWDAEEGGLVMHAEYVDPMTGEAKKARMVSRQESADREVFLWYDVTADGEVKVMEIVSERM